MNRVIAYLGAAMVIGLILGYSLMGAKEPKFDSEGVMIEEEDNAIQKARAVESTIHSAAQKRLEQAD